VIIISLERKYMNNKAIESPKPDVKDYAYAILKGAVSEIPIAGGVASEILSLIVVPPLLKGAVSEIPIAGGVASEILSLIVVPPLSKRQDEWVTSIAEGLVELQNTVEGFKLVLSHAE
jgi:hypothetical protein